MNKVQTKSALVDGLADDRCFVYLSIRINVLCSGVIVSGVCFFFVVVMNKIEMNLELIFCICVCYIVLFMFCLCFDFPFSLFS